MAHQIKSLPLEELKEQRFSPYVDNGGTALAVAGKDFVVIGGDTRMSRSYSILSRNVPKCFQLTEKCIMATSGMQAEAKTLRKVLTHKVKMYNYKHNKMMPLSAVAQMLSTTLYYKRFFPYYTFNVLAGLDDQGKGSVYGYDAVGSFERMPYCVAGSGSALITSLLDNQVAFKHQEKNKVDLSVDDMLDLVKDAFTCCGERDIYTGDSVDLYVITKDGIRHEAFPLKKD